MFPTAEELDAGTAWVRQSPRPSGRLDRIVVRPRHGERVELTEVHLDLIEGAVGDTWVRGFPAPPTPGSPEQETQLTLMNARAASLVAGSSDRWSLAGDQLFVDFDLSEDHLHAGDRVRIGAAVVEVTPKPHNGCRKFAARYGDAAVGWVNSKTGKHLHLRGICAKVVEPALIRVGDPVEKLPPTR